MGTNNQYLLPSRPTNSPSKDTPVVSSLEPPAEPNSTTVSSPSDTETSLDKTTTSSRTPGDHHGVSTDTSRSESPADKVSAVSRCNHPTQPSDQILYILIICP